MLISWLLRMSTFLTKLPLFYQMFHGFKKSKYWLGMVLIIAYPWFCTSCQSYYWSNSDGEYHNDSFIRQEYSGMWYYSNINSSYWYHNRGYHPKQTKSLLGTHSNYLVFEGTISICFSRDLYVVWESTQFSIWRRNELCCSCDGSNGVLSKSFIW